MNVVDFSRNNASVRAKLPGCRVTLGEDEPLKLDCGVELGPFSIAYQPAREAVMISRQMRVSTVLGSAPLC